ncbi:MAG: FKBP-type peptidyl-prolyl cis-trans isomerase [Chitinophagaceae bacterium]
MHQVIAGWTEALQLMPVGSKWRLFIPSSLAMAQEAQVVPYRRMQHYYLMWNY